MVVCTVTIFVLEFLSYFFDSLSCVFSRWRIMEHVNAHGVQHFVQFLNHFESNFYVNQLVKDFLSGVSVISVSNGTFDLVQVFATLIVSKGPVFFLRVLGDFGQGNLLCLLVDF